MTYSNLEEMKRKNIVTNLWNIAKVHGFNFKSEDHSDWLDVHFSCHGFHKHMRLPWQTIGVELYNRINNDLQKAREKLIKDILDRLESIARKYEFDFEPRFVTTDGIIFIVSDKINDYKQMFKFEAAFPHETWLQYLDRTLKNARKEMGSVLDVQQPKIKDVIFNGPATIVLWQDCTKTIVKAQNGETVDKEKGLAMAIVKRVYGNKGNYNDIFRKYIDE